VHRAGSIGLHLIYICSSTNPIERLIPVSQLDQSGKRRLLKLALLGLRQQRRDGGHRCDYEDNGGNTFHCSLPAGIIRL
jgi:hypothetical protein